MKTEDDEHFYIIHKSLITILCCIPLSIAAITCSLLLFFARYAAVCPLYEESKFMYVHK